jgi:hypothetical protein
MGCVEYVAEGLVSIGYALADGLAEDACGLDGGPRA